MSEAKPSMWLSHGAEALSLANETHGWLASSLQPCPIHTVLISPVRLRKVHWIVVCELLTCQNAADTYNEEPGTISHNLDLAFLPAGGAALLHCFIP
jgi:hypothetical protein